MAVKIKTNEQDPEPVELIAESIIKISEAVEKINKSKLTRHALVILIKDQCGLPQRDILRVLNSLDDLKKVYIKDPKK